LFATGTGACLLILLASCGKKQSAQTAVEAYPTQVVTKQNVTLQTVYPVSLKGKEDVEIHPRVKGFIEDIYIDEGSVVHAGQALFKIDSPESQQTLNTTKAALTSAEAQVNTAKINVERIKPLADQGIVSQVQLATYQNAYESAVAAREEAKAAYTNAQVTMGWTRVTSPVDGVAGTIIYRKGSLVDDAKVLTTIANTSNIYAYFSLNEKALQEFLDRLDGQTQAEKIKNAPDVTLTLADGTVYPEAGRLETISGVLNVTTGSANFRVAFPNPHGTLRSGTSGTVAIPRHLNQVLVVPQKATFALQDKTIIYKVDGDSVTQKTIDVIPMPDARNYVVTAGLTAGDRIVTDGVSTLNNGDKIQVK
jgi:membrane fusion protein (multidrug efflux system)